MASSSRRWVGCSVALLSSQAACRDRALRASLAAALGAAAHGDHGGGGGGGGSGAEDCGVSSQLETVAASLVDALRGRDGAHLPLRGERDADGSLRNPKVATDWDGNTPRGHVAQRAYEVVADQLVHAAVLTSSQPFTGTGGVIVTGDDGSQAPLEIGSLTAHPEFPRLIVFAAQS